MQERRPSVKFSAKFLRDFKGLSGDLCDAVHACLLDIEKEPIPQTRRVHSVTPRGHKPTIFTVDVKSNHSWKLSFVRVRQTVWALRVATHREMDRDPGRSEARRLMAEET